MNGQPSVHDLVTRWQELQQQGQTLSVEDLCADCPEHLEELKRRLREIASMQQFLQLSEDHQATVNSAPPEAAATAEHSDTADSFVPATDLPRFVAGYEILGELGRGGMGVVLRGHDPDFGRTLAVKMLLPRAARRPDAQQRFLDEARLTGQLQHPGIPPVHELGKLDNGLPFFAMKLIQGRTLATILQERDTHGARRDTSEAGPVTPTQAEPNTQHPAASSGAVDAMRRIAPDSRLIGIFRQVCQTLAYTHARGVIHRDLKPANIMVGAFGEVQVMDWGLAKQKDEGGRMKDESEGEFSDSSFIFHPSSLTHTGDVRGTPGYMAPEQARGEIRSLDQRVDVFGLGAILCEILTGRPPFARGSISDRMLQAARGQIANAFALLDSSGADAELVELAKRCLAPRREDRPRDAGEVAEAIERYEAQLQERLRRAELEREKAQVQAEEEHKRAEVEQARAAAEQARANEESRRRRAEQGKAAAERRRRRATLAFAVTALLLLSSAAGAALWYQQDRAEQATQEVARQAEDLQRQAEQQRRHDLREHRIGTALHQARKLRDALQDQLAKPGGVFPLLNQPSDWKHQLDLAQAALRHAQDLEAGAEGPVAVALRQDRQALEEQLQRHQFDREMALRLEKVREDRAVWIGGKFNTAGALQGYATAFQRVGLSLKPGREAEDADLVRRSAIKEQLLAALDDWAFVTWTHGQKDLHRRLLLVTRRADPDPRKDQIRDPALWNNPQALRALADKVQADQALARFSPQILDLLGLLQTKDKAKAEGWLRQAQALYPTDFWINYNLAITLLTAKPQQAEGFLRAAIAVRPASTAAWNNLGNALRAQKDLASAVQAYHKALQLDPNDAPSWNNLGVALIDKKDQVGGMGAYRKALQLDPKFTFAWNNLGLALYAQKDLVAAIDHYTQALKLDPKFAEAHGNLGNALKARQDFKGAFQHYYKALELAPNLAMAHTNLANLLYHQKDVAAAIPHYRQALQLNPNDARAWFNLGLALEHQQEVAEALQAFRQALQLDPRFTLAWTHLGNALQAQSDLAGAVEAYHKALEIDPNDVLAWNNLGVARAARKDLRGAVQAFRQLLKIDPNYTRAWYNLGNALHAQKDLEGAVQAYRKVLQIDPNNTQAPVPLGSVLMAQGHFGEAKQTFLQALKQMPPSHPLHLQAQHKLQLCEQLLALEQRLGRVLQGEQTTPAEQLRLAELCRRYQRRYGDAVRLYAGALAEQPQLGDDPKQGLRYQAACTAALAAAGQGKDAAQLPEQDRANLRRQALTWLKADLDWYRKSVSLNPGAGAEKEPQSPLEKLAQAAPDGPGTILWAAKTLAHWQTDPDLASLREEKPLAMLPAAEQEALRQFWVAVERVRKQALACFTESARQGSLTSQQKEQAHAIQLAAGKTYIFDLTSQAFDPLLRLEDAQGKVLAENDDIEPGKNLNSRVLFTPPRNGAYRLVATSFQQRGTGPYTLLIREYTGQHIAKDEKRP
jgi:serine/threonine protein kinase/Flp pilus assembly protein TadD